MVCCCHSDINKWQRDLACSVLFRGCASFSSSFCLEGLGACSVHWAHGVVASHPLRMRKALGSNPSGSIFPLHRRIAFATSGVRKFDHGLRLKLRLGVKSQVHHSPRSSSGVLTIFRSRVPTLRSRRFAACSYVDRNGNRHRCRNMAIWSKPLRDALPFQLRQVDARPKRVSSN